MTDKKERAEIDGTTIRWQGKAYDFASIPAALHAGLAIREVRRLIVAADNPLAEFEKLVEGKLPGLKGPKKEKPVKVKVLSPWRKAAAEIGAEELADERGIKKFLPGGKKLTDAFALLLEETSQQAAAFNAEQMKTLQKRGAVRARYMRLTAIEDNVPIADMFKPADAGAAEPPVAEAAD